MDEARAQLVVSDVSDELYGHAERVQITTRVRDASAGEDRQRSDVDDRARDDLFFTSHFGIQVSADVTGYHSSKSHSSTSHRYRLAHDSQVSDRTGTLLHLALGRFASPGGLGTADTSWPLSSANE
jgi:hypothetical protein